MKVSAVPARCRKCGGRLESDPFNLGAKHDRKCVMCGWYWTPPRTVPAKVRRVNHYAPCKVQGCGGKIDTTRNTTGLCHDCQKRQDTWDKSKKTVPPPFVEVDGVLIENRR